MKFFIDTANLAQIKEANELGVLDGVTTNPTLMAKEGIKGRDAVMQHYVDICNIVSGDVSAEVIATDFKGIVAEGEELAKLHKQIVVKVPMIKDGVKAIHYFTSKGIRSTDGLQLIAEIREIYDNYNFKTQILAASIRHAMHIINCAKLGADVATCPLSAITDLLKHPLTDIGLEKFLADAKKFA